MAYHRFKDTETGEDYGSFEAFELTEDELINNETYGKGWY